MSTVSGNQPLLKCPGSGQRFMLSWFPDDEGYPGAVVCECTFGVLVQKGSARKAMSASGHEGMAGRVRVHYVTKSLDLMKYRR